MSHKTDLILLEIRRLDAEIHLIEIWDSAAQRKLAVLMELTTEFVEKTRRELENPYAEYLDPLRPPDNGIHF